MTTTLTNRDRKRMRQIAHHLDPVVLIGDAGITDGVVNETSRALDDHELIKIKVNADREVRNSTIDALADQVGAELVQKIGKVAVLYRGNEKADPRLSNIARYT